MHVAGIIPIANFKSDFRVDYPECLLPVDAGFSMIQKAVFECAIAGCQTIWIVANDDLAPIVRQQVGEWVYDPVYYSRPFANFPSSQQKEIPIYYAPVHPKDRDRIDSYGWSALYGMHSAYIVSSRISNWVVPEKYYVAFPYGAHNIYLLRQHRDLIRDPKKNFYVSHESKTVRDGEYLSFTMFPKDFKLCRTHVKKATTREHYPPAAGEQYPSKKIPLQERWSGRYFGFDEVFKQYSLSGSHQFETDWYHNMGTWEGYRGFLGSENFIKKPADVLTRPHIHAKISYNHQEEENT